VLSASLASRGAHDPGALAAWIGRRKYGKKGMAALAHHGPRRQRHSNVAWSGQVLAFADDGDDDMDDAPSMGKLQCPNCGYRSDDADFQISKDSPSDTDDASMPEELRTPARGDYQARTGFQAPTVRTGPGGPGLSNQSRHGVILLASGRPRVPVKDAGDIIVTRSQSGTAVIRHRHGGELIGEVGRGDDGAWRSLMDGTELSPHVHQRAALQELIGNWNRTALDPSRPATTLQGPPPQPDMLSRLGVANVRAFASDDGDDTSSDGDGSDGSGLTPRGQAIYKKLIAKGKSQKAAMAMAKMAQNTKPGQFGKGG
jgi:hypothetical protein